MAGRYKAYPDYKDSGVEPLGQVPSSWVVSRLKQIVDPNRQITYGIVQAGPNVKVGIPYIRPADMTDEVGIRNVENILRTTPAIAANYERSKIEPGDIICSIGPSFGKLMITPESLNGANLTQGTARIAIKPSDNTRYYFWVLRSGAAFQQWESGVGGATFRALNLGPLAETSVPKPSLPEQKQIARFLDHETGKIDALIEKQQALIALLQEKRQAVISHAVTKGLNPEARMKDSGVEWLGEVPEHWEVSQMVHCTFVTKLTGFEYTNLWQTDESGEVIALRGFNIKERVLNLDDVEKISANLSKVLYRSKLAQGDIVFPCTGTIGNAALIESSEKFHINQNIAKIRFNQTISPKFAVYWLTSSFIRTLIDRNNTSGMQPVVLIGDIRKLPIPRFELNEQEEISNYLDFMSDRFNNLISSSEKAIELMQERRTALISAAVTGKIDVRDFASEAR